MPSLQTTDHAVLLRQQTLRKGTDETHICWLPVEGQQRCGWHGRQVAECSPIAEVRAASYCCEVMTLRAAEDSNVHLWTQASRHHPTEPECSLPACQVGSSRCRAAGFVWKQSFSRIPEIPIPRDWGWEWNARNNQWEPYWTDLSDVSKACSLLLQCGVWLPVRVIASVIELNSIAVHCASVKGAALTMKVKCDVHATSRFVLMMYTTETARFLCINPTSTCI